MKSYVKKMIKSGFDEKAILQGLNYRFPNNFECINGHFYVAEKSKYFLII